MVHMDDETGFNEITRKFKETPTLKNYVRLRRIHPDTEIQIAVSGGLEALFALREELVQWNLEPDLVVGAMDANLRDQSEMSLRLMELLLEREELKASGETHLASRSRAIGDALVNYLITAALDGCDWTGQLTITRDLIVLIKHQLGTLKSEYDGLVHTRQKRAAAIHIAAQMLGDGGRPSLGKLAKLLGVNKSTVKRWFFEEPLESAVNKLLQTSPNYMEIVRSQRVEAILSAVLERYRLPESVVKQLIAELEPTLPEGGADRIWKAYRATSAN